MNESRDRVCIASYHAPIEISLLGIGLFGKERLIQTVFRQAEDKTSRTFEIQTHKSTLKEKNVRATRMKEEIHSPLRVANHL